jgi:hypothetical protein
MVDDEIRRCANPVIGISYGIVQGSLVEGVKVPSLSAAMAITFLVPIVPSNGDEFVDGILLIVCLNRDHSAHIVVYNVVTFAVVLGDDEVVHGAVFV